MDLIPRPDRVVSAAAGVARRLLCGGHLGRLTVRARRRGAAPVAIGANPDRRYGSAASRRLART